MIAEDAPSSRNLLESKQKNERLVVGRFFPGQVSEGAPSLRGGPGLGGRKSPDVLEENRRTRFGSGRWPSVALLTDDKLRPISQSLVEAVPSGSLVYGKGEAHVAQVCCHLPSSLRSHHGGNAYRRVSCRSRWRRQLAATGDLELAALC
jgi:hypothetical protein